MTRELPRACRDRTGVFCVRSFHRAHTHTRTHVRIRTSNPFTATFNLRATSFLLSLSLSLSLSLTPRIRRSPGFRAFRYRHRLTANSFSLQLRRCSFVCLHNERRLVCMTHDHYTTSYSTAVEFTFLDYACSLVRRGGGTKLGLSEKKSSHRNDAITKR